MTALQERIIDFLKHEGLYVTTNAILPDLIEESIYTAQELGVDYFKNHTSFSKIIQNIVINEAVEPIYRDPMGERHVLTQDDLKSRYNGKMLLDVDFTAEIDTLEGPLRCSVGDWIITGVKGEKYPCKPDIFQETYQPEGDDFQQQFQLRQINDAYNRGKQDATNEYQSRYQELIFAVETKHKGETRHQTALRYIRERENQQIDTSATKVIIV